MRKSDLHSLILEFREVSSEDPPIIVGSQALYAFTDSLPEVARRSIECDFLLSSGNFGKRAEIDKKLGVFSEFQVENGFFADTLGMATVVLPDGWEQRLKPLAAMDGRVVALCLDVCDLAISKLIAGRDKDFRFLESLIAIELLPFDEFLERIQLARSKVENDVIENRLGKLKLTLASHRIYNNEVQKIDGFLSSF